MRLYQIQAAILLALFAISVSPLSLHKQGEPTLFQAPPYPAVTGAPDAESSDSSPNVTQYLLDLNNTQN